MKIKFTLAIVVAACLYAAACLQAASPNAPTFSKDVAPILNKNCASCHRAGEIAPMSLLTYEDARPWAKSIREKVSLGQMPPWHATQSHGTFANDRRLSVAEKDILIRWADAGAPKGDPKDLPPAPKFADGWEIGKPDVVIPMTDEYEVPASGTIAYQNFAMPTNFATDQWVQAIEVRPGARSVVHHILVFCREPEPRRDGSTPAYKSVVPVLPGAQPGAQGGNRRGDGPVLIASTAPGTNALTFPQGSALLIRAGSTVIFQIHYTASGKATKDRSRLGMVFAKEPPGIQMRNGAFTNPLLALPPGESNVQVDSAIEFTSDSHIYALLPHTHLRGKSWEYRMVYPDGRSETVLSVPKYDFNWQTQYVFAKPLAAPKGSRLEAVAHFDNSKNNLSNPDPTKLVKWGSQTWEEMQYTGITFWVDPAGSPSSQPVSP